MRHRLDAATALAGHNQVPCAPGEGGSWRSVALRSALFWTGRCATATWVRSLPLRWSARPPSTRLDGAQPGRPESAVFRWLGSPVCVPGPRCHGADAFPFEWSPQASSGRHKERHPITGAQTCWSRGHTSPRCVPGRGDRAVAVRSDLAGCCWCGAGGRAYLGSGLGNPDRHRRRLHRCRTGCGCGRLARPAGRRRPARLKPPLPGDLAPGWHARGVHQQSNSLAQFLHRCGLRAKRPAARGISE